MGFLSDLVGTFTGSTARDAAREQVKSAEQSQELIKEGVGQARDDVNRIFPEARQAQGQGFQNALDIFSQTLPQQADLYQQGNVGAQQALLSGLPQMNNAILGNAIDYSAMQPQQLGYNMDFSQGNQAVGYMTPEQQSAQIQMQTATQPQRTPPYVYGGSQPSWPNEGIFRNPVASTGASMFGGYGRGQNVLGGVGSSGIFGGSPSSPFVGLFEEPASFNSERSDV